VKKYAKKLKKEKRERKWYQVP